MSKEIPQPPTKKHRRELNLNRYDEISTPLWKSLLTNTRETLFPRKATPLRLTSRPITTQSTQCEELELNLLLREEINPPLWQSLATNFRDTLFPKKLPPLQLTSRPIKVNDIWGDYSRSKLSVGFSMVIHAAGLAALLWLSIAGAKVVKKATEHITLVAPPDISDYMPLSQKRNDKIGGGGGGGDHDKLVAPKGKLPKFAMHQFTPPAMVIRNDNPKLPMEPTVVVPPQVHLASVPALNYGDPKSSLPSGPASNGTGMGGGIGSGSGGGVGSGTGPGVGPGRGGGIGGGVFRVGGGVSAPRVLENPSPDYSEEARKAKYQGTVVLWLIVDANGKPRDVRVARSLGMGLDQKAIEAVRLWKFEPARKDGTPVAVQINVEVNFHLY
ncbi:MAG: energy transducer TonB [Acidobacteria bacterium]|nr:MAG: energy transducer TonB [Acidobacteriota bacterium]